jgi:hypothetical protein
VNRILTAGALGKQLIAQKSNFMRQAMVAVNNPVDAALQDFLPATELLQCFWHFLACGNQSQFRFRFTHYEDAANDDWMMLNGDQVVLSPENTGTNPVQFLSV